MRSYLKLAIMGGLLALGLAAGCHPAPKPPGGSHVSRAEQGRKQAESLALNVATGVVTAQARAIPELSRSGAIPSGQYIAATPNRPTQSQTIGPLPSPPELVAVHDSIPIMPPAVRPAYTAVITARVSSSIPYATEAEAEQDALANARTTIIRELAELDPPVHYTPTLNEVRNEFIRKDSRSVKVPTEAEREEFKKNGVDANRVYVEYDLQVTSDQVREMRTRDRVAITLRVMFGAAFAALAVFVFLRLDEWTKGYLTRWLACAAVVLVGGTVAALYFV